MLPLLQAPSATLITDPAWIAPVRVRLLGPMTRINVRAAITPVPFGLLLDLEGASGASWSSTTVNYVTLAMAKVI